VGYVPARRLPPTPNRLSGSAVVCGYLAVVQGCWLFDGFAAGNGVDAGRDSSGSDDSSTASDSAPPPSDGGADVGPIFAGDTTVGISAQPQVSGSQEIVAQPITLTQAATLQSLELDVTSLSGCCGPGYLIYAIYDAEGTNGDPKNLIISSVQFTPVLGWNQQTAPAVTLQPGNYWIAFVASASYLQAAEVMGSSTYIVTDVGHSSMPATFPVLRKVSSGQYTAHWSFYATFLH
jgi:hypothetical protein